MDHLVYIHNGYRSLETGRDSEEGRVVAVDHHSCRFGQWYERGTGEAEFSHLPSYPSIVQPHAAVHSTMHEILEQLEPGWDMHKENLAGVLNRFEQLEAHSADLIRLVDQITEEKHKFESIMTENADGDVELF